MPLFNAKPRPTGGAKPRPTGGAKPRPEGIPAHVAALDGIRGVAILMVLLTHVGGGWSAARSIYENTAGWPTTFAIPPWAQFIADRAILGVPLFFLVSAFTLTMRVVGGDDHDLGRYALRRIARVGPAYWLAGFLYVLLAGSGPRVWAPHGIGPGDILTAAIFGTAWQGGAAMAVVPGGWSVSCEVTFYLALPVIMVLIDRRIWRAVALTLLAAGLAEIHAWHLMDAGTWGFIAYANPIEQAPVFLLGITAALVAPRLALPRLAVLPLGLLLAAAFLLPFSPIPITVILPQQQFALVATLAIILAANGGKSVLASRPMRRIGQLSYSIYLVQFVLLLPCLRLSTFLMPAADWRTMAVHFLLTAGASIAVATLTYRFIEQPAIRWAAARTRLDPAFGARQRPATSVATVEKS